MSGCSGATLQLARGGTTSAIGAGGGGGGDYISSNATGVLEGISAFSEGSIVLIFS